MQDLGVLLANRSAQFLDLLAKARQHLHVALAALDFLVENHAVETLAAFGQFLREIEVRLGDETKAVDEPLHHDLRLLDSLGNLHLLLARQQRHLAHLLEIHPHRVVENIELRLRLLFFLFLGVFLAVLVTIHLGRFDDVDLHPPEPRQNRVELIRVGHLDGKRFVQVVEGEVALFLRQLDQLADAGLNIGRRRGRHHLIRLRRGRSIQPLA